MYLLFAALGLVTTVGVLSLTYFAVRAFVGRALAAHDARLFGVYWDGSLGRALPYAVALGLASAWAKFLKTQPQLAPAWFRARPTSASDSAAFVAFVAYGGAGASSDGSGGAAGAGAAGGGASGAG